MDYGTLKTEWQNALGVTDETDAILPGLVDRALRDISNSGWYDFYKDQDTIRILAPFSTGTVSVTGGSASVTFSTIPVDSDSGQVSLTDQIIKIGSDTEWYFIDAHTAGQTGATLSTAYHGTTDATATFTVYQWKYDLPSNARPGGLKSLQIQSEDRSIDVVSEDLYLTENPDITLWSAAPQVAMEIGDRQLRLHPMPDADTNVTVTYYREPTGVGTSPASTATLDLPSPYHNLILYYCLMNHATGIRDSVVAFWMRSYASGIKELKRTHNAKFSRRTRVRAWRPRLGKRSFEITGPVS